MRVYFNAEQYIEFPSAVRWESVGSDWCELYDEEENLLVVLNWKHVWLMKMIGHADPEVI